MIAARPVRLVLRGLAWCYPGSVSPGPALTRSLGFLDGPIEPERLATAARGLATMTVPTAVLGWLLLPAPIATPGATLLAVSGLAAAQGLLTAPTVLATARRTSALGAAPDLVARIVLRMRIAPAPEHAAARAAAGARGPLARSLRRHVERATAAPETGLRAFGAEWSEWFPALQRSVALVEAAASAPPADRGTLLDRSLEAVLEGTESAMRAFAADVRGPAMGVYAFGVLLPTALVSLLPAASMAGVPVTPVTVTIVYVIVLPAGLLVAAAWLLARRPLAFRPPALEHGPGASLARGRTGLGAGIIAGVAGLAGTGLFFPPWAVPIAATGYGCGTALVVTYGPVLGVYDRVAAVEAGLSDALSLVGRRIAGGQAAERAVAATGRELDGPAGRLFARGAQRQRRLAVDLEAAFLGRGGAATAVPSRRVHRSLALLAEAAHEGGPAGDALVALGDHLADLRAVEERARHDLDAVCSTLRSTGAVFGPLVAGATVALADGMGATGGFLPGGSDPLPWLGLPIGLYVLAMAAILTTLSVGLRRGLDTALAGYHVGRALLLATAALLLAYALAGTVA